MAAEDSEIEDPLNSDEEIESLEEIRQFLEAQDKFQSSSNSEKDSTDSDGSSSSFMLDSKWICGALTTVILGSIYLWNDTLGLDIITMVLSLASIIYVWTNG